MDEVQVGVVRRFNRTVTQRVGALNDSFLSRGRPLGHSRVLWEIGDGAELRELRARLDLDSGYLSRILRSLETDGLATVSTDGDDRRVRRVALTPAGLRERAALDELSDAQASAMLHPLGDRQRVELAGAMATVSRLLEASAITVAIAAPASPAVRTSMAAYFDELARRFEAGFDPAVTLPTADEQFRLPAGLVLLATLHDRPVGCVGLKLHAGGVGEVKRLWVSSEVRGLGLARRMLGRIEAEGSSRGIHTLRLDTNRALTEAIALYRALGYREIEAYNDEPYAHHWFEKRI
ncbi:MAG TPA: helix-turn-helix domain-containing GNAT family N-acetyltransferase [Rhodoglobus sp.]|nr:helix-turn-helix domain-containing GNAT family N-acetyltransferase [Rhodoglobus sp.]HQE45544.1 helix-turn-helix domain-containing GNAT family N-acetyltransferase [Rhodoglobus sp.]